MAEKTPLTPDEQDELTAYLDGELDVPGVRRVEDRLARDATYQAELQRLERTWDLLDRLPRSTVDETFTKTTIEMVAVVASEEAAAAESALPVERRRQRMLGGFGMLAAAVWGFAIGYWMWPNQNARLLEDLPVIEHFDRYYQADNIEFLHLLDQEGLFADGDSDHAT